MFHFKWLSRFSMSLARDIEREGQPARLKINVSTYDSPVSNRKETYECRGSLLLQICAYGQIRTWSCVTCHIVAYYSLLLFVTWFRIALDWSSCYIRLYNCLLLLCKGIVLRVLHCYCAFTLVHVWRRRRLLARCFCSACSSFVLFFSLTLTAVESSGRREKAQRIVVCL